MAISATHRHTRPARVRLVVGNFGDLPRARHAVPLPSNTVSPMRWAHDHTSRSGALVVSAAHGRSRCGGDHNGGGPSAARCHGARCVCAGRPSNRLSGWQGVAGLKSSFPAWPFSLGAVRVAELRIPALMLHPVSLGSRSYLRRVPRTRPTWEASKFGRQQARYGPGSN
jgi:hypothetical protein